jgi:hypothetical protein
VTIPYKVEENIFSGAVLTETKVLRSEFSLCPFKVIEIITTDFSGTIDIQGKIGNNGTYANVNHVLMSQGSAQGLANAQLSYSTTTDNKKYLVPEYYPYMQIVMARTAGSVKVNVVGLSAPVTGPVP